MTPPKSTLALALCLAFAIPAVRAADAPADDPADLSLEELLNVDVQTASRKSQRLQDVAAAVFVITRDDIERSGATSIPEALRLAPGVQVARLANNRWAVTARGFNGRFANKLLVLMDGRSIYSPLFSGVLWETEDTLLEDIDRIEVIRGPGASLWGANAVNGVINIITRKARDTDGTLAVASVGTEDIGMVALRQGMAMGDGHLRVWGKAFGRSRSLDTSGAPGNDYWREGRGGFRGDWNLDASRRLTVSGAAYSSRTGDRWLLPSYTSPTGSEPTDMSQNAQGAHLLARHEWSWADGSEAALQGYAEHSDLEVVGAVHDRRTTIDIDFQHRPHLGGAHDVIWGFGYRESHDRIDSGAVITMTPDRSHWNLLSAFLQDELTVVPDAVRLVLGARFEHNSYTGFVPQPNARLVWTPTPQRTVWGALSRAARTPSRAERGAQVDLNVVPSDGVNPPIQFRNIPDPARPLGNETVNAFELGLRQQLDAQLSMDIAMFRNDYHQLRGGALLGQGFEPTPVPHAVQFIAPVNSVKARTRGLELALDWHVTSAWRIQPIYSHIDVDAQATSNDPIAAATANEYNASAPRHQFALRSSTTLADRSQFDVWLRHVSKLPASSAGATGIAAYTTLDLRYAWRLRSGLELSVVGQNLLDPAHAEFVPDLLPSQTMQLQRGVLVKARWQF